MSQDGWVRVDCHLHTALSGDAVTSIDQLAERVEQERLDVVFITDHNVTAAAVAAAERGIGARVLVGEEIRTREGDVIGLFLTERIPYVLPLAEVTGLIRAQGGLIYLPHPFDPGRSSLGAVADELCAEGRADVIEVFNAKIEDQARNQPGGGPGGSLRAARRRRVGRARSRRHRCGLPGDAGLRRPRRLPRRAATGEDHRPVPAARAALCPAHTDAAHAVT